MSGRKKSKCQKPPLKDSKVSESGTTYQATPPTVKWNPNKPFHGTQEEWSEHFHEIEKGEFISLEEANKQFEEWKEQFLTCN